MIPSTKAAALIAATFAIIPAGMVMGAWVGMQSPSPALPVNITPSEHAEPREVLDRGVHMIRNAWAFEPEAHDIDDLVRSGALPSRGVLPGDGRLSWRIGPTAIKAQTSDRALCQAANLGVEAWPTDPGVGGWRCIDAERGFLLVYRDGEIPEAQRGYWAISVSEERANGAIRYWVHSDGELKEECSDPLPEEPVGAGEYCVPAFLGEPEEMARGPYYPEQDEVPPLVFAAGGETFELELEVSGE